MRPADRACTCREETQSKGGLCRGGGQHQDDVRGTGYPLPLPPVPSPRSLPPLPPPPPLVADPSPKPSLPLPSSAPHPFHQPQVPSLPSLPLSLPQTLGPPTSSTSRGSVPPTDPGTPHLLHQSRVYPPSPSPPCPCLNPATHLLHQSRVLGLLHIAVPLHQEVLQGGGREGRRGGKESRGKGGGVKEGGGWGGERCRKEWEGRNLMGRGGGLPWEDASQNPPHG